MSEIDEGLNSYLNKAVQNKRELDSDVLACETKNYLALKRDC